MTFLLKKNDFILIVDWYLKKKKISVYISVMEVIGDGFK